MSCERSWPTTNVVGALTFARRAELDAMIHAHWVIVNLSPEAIADPHTGLKAAALKLETVLRAAEGVIAP